MKYITYQWFAFLGSLWGQCVPVPNCMFIRQVMDKIIFCDEQSERLVVNIVENQSAFFFVFAVFVVFYQLSKHLLYLWLPMWWGSLPFSGGGGGSQWAAYSEDKIFHDAVKRPGSYQLMFWIQNTNMETVMFPIWQWISLPSIFPMLGTILLIWIDLNPSMDKWCFFVHSPIRWCNR